MTENPEFLPLVIAGGVIMLGVAFIIGANDVANSFGTSVGSKSLTLKTACILASIFETLGAVALGATVASTFENKIIDPHHFHEDEKILAVGMITSLIGSMIWLFVATFFGMPVSTTHSIIGGIIGFSIASNHISAIRWSSLGLIALSWIFSPILSGLISTSIFAVFRALIFRRTDAVKQGFRFMWILITMISAVLSAFILFGNPVSFKFSCLQSTGGIVEYTSPCVLEKWAVSNLQYSIPLTVGITLIISIISNSIIYSSAIHTIKRFDALQSLKAEEILEFSTINNIKTNDDETDPLWDEADEPKNVSNDSSELSATSHSSALESKLKAATILSMEKKVSPKKYNMKINFSVEDEIQKFKVIQKMYSTGEKFEEKIEAFSGAVQIFSACFASLAHGANDVSNAVGPFATILSLYNYGLKETTNTPHWLLLICGLFISLGLACYGHKVIRTIGIKMIHMTPCRGVCIESATALTVVVFSKFGVPLSTTYCQVGSIIGVGAIEPRTSEASGLDWILGRSVNYKLFAEIFGAWIMTIFFSGIVTAIVYLFSSLFL